MSEIKSLWGTDNQEGRLIELTSGEPDVKEAPLRRDVRSLGRLLGEVLKEQAGPALFEAVEELRLLAIEYREGAGDRAPGEGPTRSSESMQRAAEIVERIGTIEAYRQTKAFAV